MNNVKTIFGNISWLAISQFVVSVCTFLWTVIIARYLGVTEYGIFGFAISLTGILIVLADFGINTHIVRDVSTNNDLAPKYLGNAIPLKLVFAIVTFLVILAILFLMKSDELTIKVTLLFAIEMIIKSFINFFKGSFQAFEHAKYQSIGDTILHVVLFIFIAVSVFTDMGIFAIAVSYILANFITLAYLLCLKQKHCHSAI